MLLKKSKTSVGITSHDFSLKHFWNTMRMSQTQLLLVELLLIVFATVSALFLRDNFEVSEVNVVDFVSYLVFTLVAAAVILPSLQTCRSVWRFTAMADYLRILAATAAIVVGAVAISFRFNCMNRITLALPILQGLLILYFLVGVRMLARIWHAARERSVLLKAPREVSDCETVLVIGLGGLADFYLQSVAQFAPARVHIAGLLGDNDRHIGRSVHGHPILGTAEQIAGVLRGLEIHGVFVACIVVATTFEQLSPQARAALLDIKKTTNINLEFLIDHIGLGRCSGDKADFSSRGATNSFVAFSFGAGDLAALTRRPYWRVKRALDPVTALGLLVVLAPLMLFVAILTVIDVGLPVTFWQLRPGLNGRRFKLQKFRTMAPAYDARVRRQVPEKERTSGLGHLLRNSRLDELPQLFSILSGEMSFVGPRPLLPVDQPAACAARLLVRPGLTGWAQVKGGREISAADKAALDIWYVRNASLALDLKILAHTVEMVIFGETVDTAAIQHAWQELRQAGICTLREPSMGTTGAEQAA
jgi:lipopolysaccharide/colanic/teichoic acid biosynthesis glycosyltransferase